VNQEFYSLNNLHIGYNKQKDIFEREKIQPDSGIEPWIKKEVLVVLVLESGYCNGLKPSLES
jgi:hypothetical protein